jgi:hypothetical protein
MLDVHFLSCISSHLPPTATSPTFNIVTKPRGKAIQYMNLFKSNAYQFWSITPQKSGLSNYELSGKGTCAINIGRLKTYKVRMKLDKWGRKRYQNPNGGQQFPNWSAKIIIGGTQEVSLPVVPDQQFSSREKRG